MTPPYVLSRPQRVYVACAAVFLTALVIAEATAGKFFTAVQLPTPITILGERFESVVMTAGVLAFPITFIVTDVVNEYFGRAGIRYVTYLGLGMVAFAFVILQAALAVPTAPISPVPDEAFAAVFGTTTRVIVGSLTAYLLGQLLDIALFHRLREWTGGRHLWLRATGSTLGSQLLDTAVVLTIAFWGQLGAGAILAITLFNYGYKVLIAIAITPLVYLAHALIDRYLGREADRLLDAATQEDAV